MAVDLFQLDLKAKVDVADIKKQLKEVSKTTKIELDASGFRKATTDIIKLKDAMGQTYVATEKLDKAGNTLNTTLTQTATKSETLGKKFSDMGSKIQSINGIFQALKNVVVNFGQALRPILEFDAALTDFRKVSDLSGEALDSYSKKLGQLGKDVARTRSEMVEGATVFKQSGYSDEDAAILSKVAALFQNVADSEISAGDAAGIIVSQMKAFNIDAQEAEGIVDSINRVSNEFAVSSTDIATGLSKTSAAMAVLGNDMSQTIGLVTAGTEILHGQASKTARGLRTIGNNFAAAAKESDSFSIKVQGATESISLINQETGDIANTFEIFNQLSKYWDKMSNSEKQSVALAYAGKNQFEVFSAVMENFSQAIDASNAAMNSQGSAAEENAKRLESFESKINNIKGAWQEFLLALVDSQQIKDILDGVNNALRDVANNEAAINTIVTLVKTLLLLQGAKVLTGFFDGAKTSIVEFGLKFTDVVTKMNAARVAALNAGTATTQLGATLLGLKAVISPLGIIVGLLSAVALGVALYNKAQKAPSERLEKDKKTLEDTKEKYTDIKKEYDELLSRQKTLNAQGEDLNDAEKKRLELLEQQTKELKEQEKQQMANVAASTVGTLQYTQTGKKTIRKGSEFAVVDTKEVYKGQQAFEAMAQAVAEATEQYEKGEITLSDYNSRTSELNDQLNTVYDSYLEVIRSGGELNEQDQRNYETLVDLKVAWVEAEGSSTNYAKALAKVSPNTEVAIKVTDLFKNSLTQVGGTYYYVSQAAKEEAVATAQAAKQAAEAELQSAKKRILAHKAISTSLKSNALLAGKNFAKVVELQNAVAEAEAQLQAAQNIQVSAPSSTTTGGGSTSSKKSGSGSKGSGSSEASKKARELLEKYKKELEEYQKVQEDAYKKGEISASKYYSNIQKKGKALWRDLKKRGKDYADSAQSMFDAYVSANSNSVKEIFSELDYRYKESDLTGRQYYNNLWKYANKFYKNGKLSFDKYRDYVSKGYDALFDQLEDNYNDGKITAEQYQEQVKKAQEDANKAIQNATKKGLIDKSVAGEIYNLLVKRGAEAANSVAKALHDSMVKAAKQAVAEAEAEFEKAQKRQSQAETYINALQFWSDEEQERIDKVIDGYNDEIDKLQEQLDLLDKQNDELDKQAERVKLVNALEDAKKKKVRIYDAKYGWIWGEDKKAVSDAQTALDEFDKEQARQKEKDAINAEIKALEELIKKKEAEKKAYQDVIDEQTKALNRYNIEAQLGATIEEAIFQDRIENFDNWKNSYISGIQEVISAIEAVNNAQSRLDFSQSELDRIEAEEVPEIKTGTTTTTGATYKYTDDMSKQEKRNAAVRANINQRKAQGYTVTEWYDDKGNLHYKATLPKKNKRAAGDVSIPKSGVYNVNELGDELIVPPKGNFDYLKKGTGVVPANLTKNLMDWGRFNPKNLFGKQSSNVTNDHSITIQNLTVQSDNAKDFVRQLQNLAIVKQ